MIETPITAKRIKIVSHKPAVIITGMTRFNLAWFAP